MLSITQFIRYEVIYFLNKIYIKCIQIHIMKIEPNGTLLSKFMPAFFPVTLLYHFNQFGALQPYLGAGFAPVFSLAQRDDFNTGVSNGAPRPSSVASCCRAAPTPPERHA